MSKDLTQKLNGSLEDKVDRLIAAVQSLDTRIESLDPRIEFIVSGIESIDARIESMDARIESMDARIESMDARIESMDARLRSVEDRLGSLETKVEDRLKETRPMWESVQAQLLDLKESQERLRADMEKGFRIIDRRLEVQPIEWSRLRGYQRDVEERVEKIEKRLE